MKYIKISGLIFCLILLQGCATPSTVQDMAYVGEDALASYDLALTSQIAIARVSGGKKTNPLWASKVSNQSFSDALQLSLNAQSLYSSSGRYRLTVDLMKLKQPFSGLNMTVYSTVLNATVTSIVRYRLTDSQTNELIMDEVVESPYRATMLDTLYGFKRLKLANQGAIKANIQGLLLKLSAVQVTSEDLGEQP